MLNRLKISLVLAPLALLLLAGAYIYTLWAAEQQKSKDLPVEAVGMMMRDLLKYHEKLGSFTQNLSEMEGVIWEKKETRIFSLQNRGLIHRNYFYLFTRLDPHRSTVWAIPIGKLRDEAPSWFLTITPEACRRWKGPAISYDSVRKLNVEPSFVELSTLGLAEQPGVAFKIAGRYGSVNGL